MSSAASELTGLLDQFTDSLQGAADPLADTAAGTNSAGAGDAA